MAPRRGGRLLGAALLGGALLISMACGGGTTASAPAAVAPANAPASDDPTAPLKRDLEIKVLPAMSQPLSALVQEQPWYRELTPEGARLAEAVLRCEKAAKRRGETASVLDMLTYATEQGWYGDGLDERELKGLTGVFDAYARSLADMDSPPVGSVLASTLRLGLFETVNLRETGEMVVLVSAQSEAAGRRALALTIEALPPVENVVGKYPYQFLHVVVTDELPEHVLGVSMNEFIAIGSNVVQSYVVVHELTHSTMYGIFPLWFEEGLAHFLENYQTGSLGLAERKYTNELNLLRRDIRLDLRPKRYTATDQYAERAQGFLFMKALFDIEGIEGLSQTIRALRTRTYSDQDLLRALVAQAPTDQQPLVTQMLCQRVLGSTRDFCSPGQ